MQTPVLIKMGDLMTDEEFFTFCQLNDTLDFERDSERNIICMSPTGSSTGNTTSTILGELYFWNKQSNLGYCFDSSTGFLMPNDAVRSPDAAWIKKERWEKLTNEQKEKFAPLCPDFVVEVRSKTDSLTYLQDKMNEYITNGCRLGWLIDRLEEKTYIYRLNKDVETVETFESVLNGEEVLPNFVFELKWIQ
ncbi:Uma2 family endonuclease [Runella sp. CRIBMP]|uniref:Uma2 family endonuclease n=1 Tax=Runella sp. CRIBMP TaxID=2683261 RepID=UPI00141220CB|nr:Uma2 family endonuclease [Runella sp. CRIBMP]NBB22123.1 Uma2 family endonuclease [Runella sp. CRIBMP]